VQSARHVPPKREGKRLSHAAGGAIVAGVSGAAVIAVVNIAFLSARLQVEAVFIFEQGTSGSRGAKGNAHGDGL